MSLVAHPLICNCAEVGILNFEYYIIFVMFFSTPQNTFKTEKKSFIGQSFLVWPIRNSKFQIQHISKSTNDLPRTEVIELWFSCIKLFNICYLCISFLFSSKTILKNALWFFGQGFAIPAIVTYEVHGKSINKTLGSTMYFFLSFLNSCVAVVTRTCTV